MFSITTAGSTWSGMTCDAISCTDTRTFTADLDLTWFKFAVAPALECENIHDLTSIELEETSEPESRFLIAVEKDCTDYTVAKTPHASLPPTVPEEFSSTITGVVIDPVTDDAWTVPHKFY